MRSFWPTRFAALLIGSCRPRDQVLASSTGSTVLWETETYREVSSSWCFHREVFIDMMSRVEKAILNDGAKALFR